MRNTAAILAILIAGTASVACQYYDQDSRGLPKTSANAPPPELRVDINHGSAEDLLKVPGMTRSWAGRIVRFRPYRTKEDLVENGVIPESIYFRIRDYIIAHQKPQ